MTYGALIVDDEVLARRGLRRYVDRHPDYRVVGDCASGTEAVEVIARARPDVVFLDVHMPGMDGFGVVDRLGENATPFFVFVTAYDEYAARAFDVEAVDYVLKPIDEPRVTRALNRVRDRLREVARPSHGSGAPARGDERVVLRTRDRVVYGAITEIDRVVADGNYVRVSIASQDHRVRGTMEAFERRLAPHGFVRVGRSALVNPRAVTALQHVSKGSYRMWFRDGHSVRSSRHYRHRLAPMLGP